MAVFSLHSVHQLREAERDQWRQKLAATRATEAASEAGLAELRSRLEQLRQWLRCALIPGQVEIGDVLALKLQEQALRKKIVEQQRRQEELAVEGERQRAALAASDCEVRMLDRLAQRQQQQDQQQSLRQEARELDDLASSAVRRRPPHAREP